MEEHRKQTSVPQGTAGAEIKDTNFESSLGLVLWREANVSLTCEEITQKRLPGSAVAAPSIFSQGIPKFINQYLWRTYLVLSTVSVWECNNPRHCHHPREPLVGISMMLFVSTLAPCCPAGYVHCLTQAHSVTITPLQYREPRSALQTLILCLGSL